MRRHSPEERQTHIELWQQSGKTKAEYCREVGLPYHCLFSWTRSKRDKEVEQVPIENGFVAIEMRTEMPDRPGLVIQAGQWGTMQFSVSASPSWIASILREMHSC